MLLTVIASLVIGALAPLETKLTWHAFAENDSKRGYGSTQRSPLLAEGVVPEGFHAPTAAFHPRFFKIEQSQLPAAVGVAAKSKQDGPIDEIWIDWDLDMKFEDSERATIRGPLDPKGGNVDAVFAYATPPK
jgi:hypothetical protein